jgi:hypothetical protein
MSKHIQIELPDGRDHTNDEKQANRHICAHWTEKGDFTLIVGERMGGREKREEACTNVLLNSGTWRRTATRLRVDLASSRGVEPSDRTRRSRDQCAQTLARRSRAFENGVSPPPFQVEIYFFSLMVFVLCKTIAFGCFAYSVRCRFPSGFDLSFQLARQGLWCTPLYHGQAPLVAGAIS